MPFKKGRKKTGGKQVGHVNKITRDFRESLERNGFDPTMAMMDIYAKSMFVYDNYAKVYEAICKGREMNGLYPTTDNAHQYLRIAADMVKDIAGYTFPKLKAIEHTNKGLISGMTEDQKLQMAKQAVRVLEAKSGRDDSSTDS